MVLLGNDVLTGINMLFVGFVLLIVALQFQGKVGGKETAYMCILTGTLNALTAFYLGFVAGNFLGMGAFLLFAFTYFFFAMNVLGASDTFTGLGWYALGVAVTTIPFVVLLWNIDTVMALMWIAWGQLWFLFFVLNGLKKDIMKLVIADTYVVVVLNIAVGLGYHMFGSSLFGI